MQQNDKKDLTSKKVAKNSSLASNLRNEERSLRVLGFTLHQARAMALLKRELLHAKSVVRKLRQPTNTSSVDQ
tara:strand:- start:889 stop:1107 length:219 start_codon:yes stop_codon:yes gene_type:complete